MSFISLCSICNLPIELADYPPLAQQFFLKNIKPTRILNEPWGTTVKCLFEGLCKSKEMVIDAVIDSRNNTVLYLDSEVTTENIRANST